jgi:hypothetical protein
MIKQVALDKVKVGTSSKAENDVAKTMIEEK